MGKGAYLGGSTTIGPRSGWFSRGADAQVPTDRGMPDWRNPDGSLMSHADWKAHRAALPQKEFKKLMSKDTQDRLRRKAHRIAQVEQNQKR